MERDTSGATPRRAATTPPRHHPELQRRFFLGPATLHLRNKPHTRSFRTLVARYELRQTASSNNGLLVQASCDMLLPSLETTTEGKLAGTLAESSKGAGLGGLTHAGFHLPLLSAFPSRDPSALLLCVSLTPSFSLRFFPSLPPFHAFCPSSLDVRVIQGACQVGFVQTCCPTQGDAHNQLLASPLPASLLRRKQPGVAACCRLLLQFQQRREES